MSVEERGGNVGEVVDRDARIGPLAKLMAFLATVALSLTAVSLFVIGGALFALFLFFPLFLFGLVGVLAGLGDRTVQQHDPAMDGRRWRDGS